MFSIHKKLGSIVWILSVSVCAFAQTTDSFSQAVEAAHYRKIVQVAARMPNQPPIFLGFVQDTITLDSHNEGYWLADLIVGTPNTIVEGVHSFQFDLRYLSAGITLQAPRLQSLGHSWFGQPHEVRTTTALHNGRLRISFEQIRAVNAQGWGVVGRVGGGIIGDNIMGRTVSPQISFAIENIQGTNVEGDPIDFEGCSDSIMVIVPNALYNENIDETDIIMLPSFVNQGQDIVINNTGRSFSTTIIDNTGRVIAVKPTNHQTVIETTDLPTGLYFVKVKNNTMEHTYKIFISK